MYAAEVFKCTVTEQHICEWSGLVGYRGGPGKSTLACNVTDYLEFPLWEEFAAISNQDGVRIHEKINMMLH